MSEDLKDIIKVIVFLVVILGGLVLVGSCNSGWSVAGYEI
tara:strand:+ start:172 stop:291 length:120 start_codon:yes stop_codon:yes gene_type:complete